MMSRSIDLSVVVKASPEAVFRALTDARELERWFPSTAESDPRPGGAFRYTFTNQNAQHDHVREGRYLEVVPLRKVSYPWHMAPGEAPTTVEFTVIGGAGETTVSLVHSGWATDPAVDQAFQMHVQGWGFFLQNLKAVLEGGRDERAARMGMKTGASV
jgi:uncharacterized protein YndB with AHSA1/START domain